MNRNPARTASGPLLASTVPLSFWGGVEAATGRVIDHHHPLCGESLAGRILALPGSRGSCSGSGVLLDLMLNGHAPAGLILARPDAVLMLGARVAAELFGRDLPLVILPEPRFSALKTGDIAVVGANSLVVGGLSLPIAAPRRGPPLALSAGDSALLAGAEGPAAMAAMRIIRAVAEEAGAERLIDVSQAHIDACVYAGPANLAFARKLAEGGARVRVATTLNAISVDERRWRGDGVDPDFGAAAAELGRRYVAMGAAPSFTCAPYQLAGAPAFGEQIAWAESNAVAYANSVIGAKTEKYPDFLDACIAITGRAPLAGCHTEAGRRPVLSIAVTPPEGADDSFWPLLGHVAGTLAGEDIPLLTGLERTQPGEDDLRALCAAFATTSAAPMLHIAGITPEARQNPALFAVPLTPRRAHIGRADLAAEWQALNAGDDAAVDLVALGNPHLSQAECARLAGLVAGRRAAPGTALMLTMSRAIEAGARAAGHLRALEAFGARILTDTCWCMLETPVIPAKTRAIMTNSAKYAHYGPGLTGRRLRFGALAACIEAAATGEAAPGLPGWLTG